MPDDSWLPPLLVLISMTCFLGLWFTRDDEEDEW